MFLGILYVCRYISCRYCVYLQNKPRGIILPNCTMLVLTYMVINLPFYILFDDLNFT